MEVRNLDHEEALKLSNDQVTATQALKLIKSKYWTKKNRSHRIISGQFKGKSIQVYTPYIDLKGTPGFKCNCSSRRNPCKHSLALLLVFIDDETSFKSTNDFPKHINEWVANRDAGIKVISKSSSAEERLAASSANRAKRIQIMKSGALDVQTWCQDVLRQGLASLEGQSETFWNGIIGRLVDNKLGGLVSSIRFIRNTIQEESDWPSKVAIELGWLTRVLSSLQNLEDWPEAWQRELLRIGGIHIRKDELEGQKGIMDDWVRLSEMKGVNEDGGNYRYSWFFGKKSGAYGELIEYNYQDDIFPKLPKIGFWFPGEMLFYPSPYPNRVLIKNIGYGLHALRPYPGTSELQKVNDIYLTALKQNPWIKKIPISLNGMTPQNGANQEIIDRLGATMQVQAESDHWWNLMAISGGAPIPILGLWNGHYLEIIGSFSGSQYLSMASD